jgi:CelD/BcsL family acetyltransferase involved in cellulose biosynthesis
MAIPRRAGPLSVERLPGPKALAAIVAEWNLLESETAPRTPFSSSTYIIPWWQHFARRGQMLFRDEFFCHIVRSDGGRLVAVAPLMRTSAPGIGAPLVRIVQFFGSDPDLTEIRGLICRPEDEPRVVNALVEYFLSRSGEWDVFRWTGLRSAVDTYCAPLPGVFKATRELPDYIVELPRSWENLHEQLSVNMRKNLHKAYKVLARDGFAFALRVTERSEAVAAATVRFFTLHAARSEAADLIFHANRFVQPNVRAFFAEYLHSVAERGELRIFELEIGGVVVASRIALLLGSDLYMHLAGYDPAWKTYSVMTVLVAEMFKWALAHGVKRINLSSGQDQSKMRWKPHEVLFRDVVQVSPALRGRVAFGLFRAYEALGGTRLKATVLARGREQPVDRSQPGVADPRGRHREPAVVLKAAE